MAVLGESVEVGPGGVARMLKCRCKSNENTIRRRSDFGGQFS